MTLTVLVSLLMLIVLTAIASLWYWYERRGLGQYEPLRNRAIYICIRCGKVYRGPRDRELMACPDCHYDNLRLHF